MLENQGVLGQNAARQINSAFSCSIFFRTIGIKGMGGHKEGLMAKKTSGHPLVLLEKNLGVLALVRAAKRSMNDRPKCRTKEWNVSRLRDHSPCVAQPICLNICYAADERGQLRLRT